MPDVTPQRSNIKEEPIKRRRSLSESLFFLVAAAINFINNFQYDSHQFHLNGLYRKGVGVVGSDGIFPILFNMEIVGITMWNRKNGSGGNTTLDVQWLSGSGVIEGSIFSTKPSFNNNVGDNAYLLKNVLSDTVVTEPALGATAPVLSKTQFNAGDALLLVIDSAMTAAEDCTLVINFRPR